VTDFDHPIDPPAGGWQRQHIDTYVATDGEDGHIWRGVPTLLLTTLGAKSGQARRTPLIYGESDGAYLIVASRGGTPGHPDWYHNLREHPEVRVQIKGDRFTARARTATPEEKPALWKIMTNIWPDYDSYQQKTTRDIPVVVLERV
jgi:deazaflavin-dependent oxidoreductase (nitroreductase family)